MRRFFIQNEVLMSELLPTQQFKVSRTDFAVFYMFTENPDYLNLKDQGDFLKLANNLSVIKERTKLNCQLYVINFDEHNNRDLTENLLKEFNCSKEKKCNIRTYVRTAECSVKREKKKNNESMYEIDHPKLLLRLPSQYIDPKQMEEDLDRAFRMMRNSDNAADEKDRRRRQEERKKKEKESGKKEEPKPEVVELYNQTKARCEAMKFVL